MTTSVQLLPVYESPSNLRILMGLFEEFTHLCYLNRISFWIDWGTELGALRHGGIIPWDIDCDTCLTKENYEKLLELFAENNYTIGNLTCDPDGYNDRHGCCWIFDKKYLYLGKDYFGIDCVSYDVGEKETKTLMSQSVVDGCPASPSSYDYNNSELYPLKLIPLVGNFVFIPAKATILTKRYYGEEGYLKYPEHEYHQWLKFNANRLFLLQCPFKMPSEVSSIGDGFKLGTPFIVRQCTDFDIDRHKLKELFINEKQMSSWFETKEELFVEDVSNSPRKLMEKWEADQMTTNITDSPVSHVEFLPKPLRDRLHLLKEDSRSRGLTYVLTNRNTLTKLHVDTGGGGWIYLKEGKKLWWFISPEDLNELNKNNYSIEQLRELSFTDLVFLHDCYLWGKIYIALQEKNDFICFPEFWAHRVFTYDKAFGLGGYAR